MRYRCYNCPDRRLGRVGQFREFEGDGPQCPECGAGEPAVVELTDVHFLVPDGKGPIQGLHGRHRVGCDAKREYLAGHARDTYAASADPRAVTCPSCRGLPAWREAAAQFQDFARGLQITDPGCC